MTDNKTVGSRIPCCVVLAFAMLSIPPWRASALMSNEVRARIEAETDAVRARVETQEDVGAKQSVLRSVYSKSESPYVRKYILEVAETLEGSSLEPFLLAVLRDDSDVRLRILAVRALAHHGSTEAAKALLDCAENDPEGEGGWECARFPTTARWDAYFALSEIGLRYPDKKPAIAESIAALPVTADNLHDAKVMVLYILTQDRELLRPFFERFHHEDPWKRIHAVSVFGLLKLTEAPKELLELLNDPIPRVRACVAQTLGVIGDPVAVPALIKIAENKGDDRGVRCNAIYSLGRMRAKSAETVLRELLDDESVKVNAAIALSQITGKRHPLVPQGYRLD